MAVSAGGAFRVPRDLEASSYARESVFSHLGGWVPDSTLDDVLLIVSELVTNAAVHGEGEISVRTELEDECVHGQVTDEGPGFERTLSNSDLATHGLDVVDRLADEWDVADGASHVWFSVGLAGRNGCGRR
jgi:anti-sigma regulatory factor (Ser/Thr protein kinase)